MPSEHYFLLEMSILRVFLHVLWTGRVRVGVVILQEYLTGADEYWCLEQLTGNRDMLEHTSRSSVGVAQGE